MCHQAHPKSLHWNSPVQYHCTSLMLLYSPNHLRFLDSCGTWMFRPPRRGCTHSRSLLRGMMLHHQQLSIGISIDEATGIVHCLLLISSSSSAPSCTALVYRQLNHRSRLCPYHTGTTRCVLARHVDLGEYFSTNSVACSKSAPVMQSWIPKQAQVQLTY